MYAWLTSVFPVTRLFEFALGMVLGLIFSEYRPKTKTVSNHLFTTLELGTVMIVCLFFFFSSSLGIPKMFGIFFVPMWAVLIYVFAFEQGVLSKILSNKFLVYLGEISFAFYMVHNLILYYMEFLSLPIYLNAIIALIASIGLSSIVYKFYEEPLRKWIRYGMGRGKRELNLNSNIVTKKHTT